MLGPTWVSSHEFIAAPASHASRTLVTSDFVAIHAAEHVDSFQGLAAASAVLAKTTEQEANVARAIINARLERLYQFSQTPEGKRLDPVKVLRAQAKLLGLYAA